MESPPSLLALTDLAPPVAAAAVRRAAAAAGLTIPDACMAGVLLNLALLGRHAALLGGVADPV